MSELPGESSVPEMNTGDGVSDVLQAEIDGRSRALGAPEGLLGDAAVPGSIPGLRSAPHFHRPLGLCEVHRHQLFHQYLHHSSLVPVRLLRDISERRRLFVEGCKAREAAFDADPPQMDSHALAFILALTAADARSPLAH